FSSDGRDEGMRQDLGAGLRWEAVEDCRTPGRFARADEVASTEESPVVGGSRNESGGGKKNYCSLGGRRGGGWFFLWPGNSKKRRDTAHSGTLREVESRLVKVNQGI